MAGRAHLFGHTRWPGMPTSGRFVYKSRRSGDWYWQCDLHDEPESLPDQWGAGFKTLQEAFEGARKHAETCVPYFLTPEQAQALREAPDDPSRDALLAQWAATRPDYITYLTESQR